MESWLAHLLFLEVNPECISYGAILMDQNSLIDEPNLVGIPGWMDKYKSQQVNKTPEKREGWPDKGISLQS